MSKNAKHDRKFTNVDDEGFASRSVTTNKETNSNNSSPPLSTQEQAISPNQQPIQPSINEQIEFSSNQKRQMNNKDVDVKVHVQSQKKFNDPNSGRGTKFKSRPPSTTQSTSESTYRQPKQQRQQHRTPSTAESTTESTRRKKQHHSLQGFVHPSKKPTTSNSGLGFTIVTEDDVLVLMGLERRTENLLSLGFFGGKNKQYGSPFDHAWDFAESETSTTTTIGKNTKPSFFRQNGFTQEHLPDYTVAVSRPQKSTFILFINEYKYPIHLSTICNTLPWLQYLYHPFKPQISLPITPKSISIPVQMILPKSKLYITPSELIDDDETNSKLSSIDPEWTSNLHQWVYSSTIEPFPQYPLSYSIQTNQYNEISNLQNGSVERLLSLPLQYDYHLYHGDTFKPFPSNGLKSLAIPTSSITYQDSTTSTTESTTTTINDITISPSVSQHISLHWVSLKQLYQQFSKMNENEYNDLLQKEKKTDFITRPEPDLNIPVLERPVPIHEDNIPTTYNYHTTTEMQKKWNSITKQEFTFDKPSSKKLTSRSQILKDKANRGEQSFIDSETTVDREYCRVFDEHGRIIQSTQKPLFITKTISGMEFPLSILAFRLIICRWGLFHHYQKHIERCLLNDQNQNQNMNNNHQDELILSETTQQQQSNDDVEIIVNGTNTIEESLPVEESQVEVDEVEVGTNQITIKVQDSTIDIIGDCPEIIQQEDLQHTEF